MTKEEKLKYRTQCAKNAIKEYRYRQALLQEQKYCDRNICLRNEYNNIGCDECEVTKSQEPIFYPQVDGITPTMVKQEPCDDLISCVKHAIYKVCLCEGNKDIFVKILDEINKLPSVNPQEPKWIPVSERLPKIAGIYRVTRYYPNNVMNPNYLVDACCFDGSNTWYDDNRINHDRAYADNVIAWQENPEPYKVEPQERSEE